MLYMVLQLGLRTGIDFGPPGPGPPVRHTPSDRTADWRTLGPQGKERAEVVYSVECTYIVRTTYLNLSCTSTN
jgi:hypothetical protein